MRNHSQAVRQDTAVHATIRTSMYHNLGRFDQDTRTPMNFLARGGLDYIYGLRLRR